jgi:ribosomal subunit interface protein
MQIPLQITFRDMEPSPAVEAQIRERAGKLEQFFDRITGCHVVVGARHRHQHKGKLYALRIDLHVPGQEIIVDHVRLEDHAHEDVYVAIRDAFDAAARQLEDHVRRFRGDVKAHEVPLHGKVLRLFPDHGFIETTDGQEVYFHKNSVVDGRFDELAAGSAVRLVTAESESAAGSQATTVVPLGKHHLPD